MTFQKCPSDIIKSALFVDFDNIFMSLLKVDPGAAWRFADHPERWFRWIEAGMPTDPNSAHVDQPRAVLIRRCYLNLSNRYFKICNDFTNSGFSIIACPMLTHHGKNSVDIHIVIDILDTLQHQMHVDEFIVMSGDSDFTPVLLRLRVYDRRTTIISANGATNAYMAASDRTISGNIFMTHAVGKSPKNLLDEMAKKVHAVVSEKGAIPITYLPRLFQEFPEYRDLSDVVNYLGFETQRNLTLELARRHEELALVGGHDGQPWKVALRPPVSSERIISAAPVRHESAQPGRPSEPQSEASQTAAPTHKPMSSVQPPEPLHEPMPSVQPHKPDGDGHSNGGQPHPVRVHAPEDGAPVDEKPPRAPEAPEPHGNGRINEEPSGVTSTPPDSDFLDKMIAKIQEIVAQSQVAVPLEKVAAKLGQALGKHAKARWDAEGGFRKFLQNIRIPSVELIIVADSQGYLYDPARHKAPSRKEIIQKAPVAPAVRAVGAQAAPSSLVSSALITSDIRVQREETPQEPSFAITDFPALIQKVRQVIKVPNLTSEQYAVVFQAISDSVREHPHTIETTVTDIQKCCLKQNVAIIQAQLSFILKGIEYARHKLGVCPEDDTPSGLATSFSSVVLWICSAQHLELSTDEQRLIDEWIRGATKPA